MNKWIGIGNLTRDPETRTVSSGNSVCTFTIAVNRRNAKPGQQEADFFRVSAWGKLGEICQKWLLKGRKCCVVGPVSVSTYEGRDGSTRFSLDIMATDVQFLSPKSESGYDNGAFEPSDADDSGFDDFDSKGFLDGLEP